MFGKESQCVKVEKDFGKIGGPEFCIKAPQWNSLVFRKILPQNKQAMIQQVPM